MEVSNQIHAPATLAPGKEPSVPIGKWDGWTPGPVLTLWRREKSLRPAGNGTQPVQLVAHRHEDWGNDTRARKIHFIKSMK
jgi:hypothetical protein